MKRNSKMKNSGNSWIGMIPEEWNTNFLFQVAIERKVSNKNVHHQNLLSLSYGRIVQKDINTTEGLLPASFDSYQVVENGNVVLRLTDLQNDHKSLRVGLATQEGIITSAYVALECFKKTLYPTFFYYQLHSFDVKKMFYGMGGGLRQSLTYDELKKIQLAVPPLEEQKAIAEFLDNKTKQINELVSAKQKQIELLKEYKQAVIAKAVTQGVNPKTKMKDSGISWIGQIPEHWDVNYLFQKAKEHFISNKNIHHQNLLSLSYGRIVQKNINSTEGLLPESFDTYQIVENGNVVLRLTDLQNDHRSLRVGLVTQEGIITSAYVALEVLNETLNSEYFYFQLHTFDIKKMFYGMGGGLRQNLNYNELKKIKIAVPPPEEQPQIVSYIQEKVSAIDSQISSIEKQIANLNEYKQSLISDVVTGKVKVA